MLLKSSYNFDATLKMNDKVLFLLDAYALIYRAYYALIRAPRMTSKGFNTSAIFGFVNTLDELLKNQNPSHVAVCFDPSGPTFRHEAYPGYKAQRDKQPEDITLSIPYIKDIIKANGIPIVEVEGYEADDVIGTLAHRAAPEGFTTYMMTPDKDYGQLVTDNVFIYKPALRGGEPEIRGPKEVCERFGISTPLQMIDLLALEGDAIDNIPGCPGVGEKTAQKLIAEWGSVDNLLANAGSLKGALKKKVEDNAEQIRFSRYLATICTDAPIELDPDSLRRQAVDVAELTRIYTELEFRTFLKRLPQPEASMPEKRKADATGMGSLFDEPEQPVEAKKRTISDFSTDYSRLEPDMIPGFIAEALRSRRVGVAAYAVGGEDMTSVWQGIAISPREGMARYIRIPADPAQRAEIAGLLAPLFTSRDVTIVSHDVKREMILLRREGVVMTAPYYDTAVAHYLLEPEMNHALPRVSAAYLGYNTLDYEEDEKIRRKGEPIPSGEEIRRVCEVADVTLKLGARLKELVREQSLDRLMDDIELPLIKVLADMEWTGVRIDVNVLAELSRKFSSKLAAMENEAYRLAGGPFNIGSPTQVGDVLFGRLNLDPNAKKTKRGAYSTTEEVLEKYRDVHPIVDLILEIRGLKKLLATYIDALPQLINPRTGKIHTTFNQTVTATGRISSTTPNLQNIPIRTEEGREIRRAFIPDKGNLLMSADYSQIELRVIADISGDKDMIEAFLSDTDIHRATAAKIYHENIGDVTDEQRRRAKTANFGIIYGISAFGLAQRLRISRTEAKELIDGYFRTYPHIKEYIAESIDEARNAGYVSTVMGRKRMLPEINSRNAVVRGYAERNAVNAPIQGTSADIIKLAMVNIFRDFDREGLKSKMIIQVHDELVFDVVPDELEKVKEIVVRDMMGAFSGKVPLIVSSGVGMNWLEAH